MTYSIHNEFRIVSPPGHDASMATMAPIGRLDDAAFYTGLGAKAHAGVSLLARAVEDDAGGIVPASHMRFKVTVADGQDTDGQLERMLGKIRREAPAGAYAIQQINVSGVVYAGGTAADLAHNRELAFRNEDYVQGFLASRDVRPELGVNARAKKAAEFPDLPPPARHATERNVVYLDVVYRRRTPGELTPKGADRSARCAKRGTNLLGTHSAGAGLRALSASPAMALPVGGGAEEIMAPVPRPLASPEKVWLRRCPVRKFA